MQVSEYNPLQLTYMMRLIGLADQTGLSNTARNIVANTADNPNAIYTPVDINKQVNIYQKQANDMLNLKLKDIATSYAAKGEYFSGGRQLAQAGARDDTLQGLEKLKYQLTNQNRQGLFNAYTQAYNQQQNATAADINQLLAPMFQAQDVTLSRTTPGGDLAGIGGLASGLGSLIGNLSKSGN